jgi:hypothetical protein
MIIQAILVDRKGFTKNMVIEKFQPSIKIALYPSLTSVRQDESSTMSIPLSSDIMFTFKRWIQEPKPIDKSDQLTDGVALYNQFPNDDQDGQLKEDLGTEQYKEIVNTLIPELGDSAMRMFFFEAKCSIPVFIKLIWDKYDDHKILAEIVEKKLSILFEDIRNEISIEVAGIGGILNGSAVGDTGQSHIAQMKLGKILEVLDSLK